MTSSQDVRNGQLRDMCAQVGLDVVSIRRLRIGREAVPSIRLTSVSADIMNRNAPPRRREWRFAPFPGRS